MTAEERKALNAKTLADAIAKIEAHAAADYAERQRIYADPVVVRLTAMISDLSLKIGVESYGYAGFAEIAAYRQSARSIRKQRAAAMLRRRIANLHRGYRAADNGLLDLLAKLRREEKHRGCVEACMAHLAGVDAALKAVAA